MSSEKKTMKKGKFNIIDLILVLSIVAVIAASVYAAVKVLGIGGEIITVKYTVEVPEVRDEFVTMAAVGDSVFDYESGEMIGKVVSVSSNPAKHIGFDSSGSPVTSEIDGYRTLYLTIETEAEKNEAGYFTGDYGFTVSSGMKLRLPGIYLEGTCIDIDTAE